jgi:hypothetical protein
LFLTVSESLRRLHHRLIRLRLLSEHSFGQLTLRERLLHIRPLSGFLLSTPAILFVLWYSGLAVSSHLRQVSAVKVAEPLTPELFQLHLHDRLSADVRRLRMPEPQDRSELPTYKLVVSNDRLSQLDTLLPPDEGKGNYVEAFLVQKNRVYEIEARYRGAKHWHWNGPQKSWKIRVKGNHLMFEGLPTFNFVNTPDPMPFNEQMVLDVARDAGLLTPAYYPFRMQLNNAFLGVYFFEAQADEGLLRRNHRMPGSIYSGAGAPIDETTQVSSLWQSAKHWKKVGAAGDKTAHDVRELDALLNVVQTGTAREFSEFADVALDIEKFATFDAIDVVFGNNQHDYHQNHKLYFDPYKSRFEPIATDFRDMEHERQFNRTEHPLLLRLKQLPDYLTRRNRKVYEMITGTCSPSAIAARTQHWMDILAPDQARDPYWDAYELLPVMGNYYRQLLRPMNEDRQAVAARMRLHEHELRSEYLRRELERSPVTADLYVASATLPAASAPAPAKSINAKTLPSKAATRKVGTAQPDTSKSAPVKPVRAKSSLETSALEFVTALDITVSGPAAFEWQQVVPEFATGCNPSEWQIFADRDLDQKLSDGDIRLAAVAPPLQIGKPDITLTPGTGLRQINPNPYRGRVRAEVEPVVYRFFVRSLGCSTTNVTVSGKNTSTLAPVSATATQRQNQPPQAPVSCEDRHGFAEPGSKTLHPFCSPFVREETIHIGPGVVEFPKTQIYSKHQTVVIEPNTTIVAASGASLIAYGKVIAEGRKDAPIRFTAQHGHWGGLALEGPATAGSRFAYVDFISGTKPELSFFDLPGMVNIHDTRDIRLSFVRLAGNEKSDDALHVAYVDGLVLTDAVFERVLSDALDIEYSSAKVSRLDVTRAGDDGLDLMGSKVELSDSRFVRCKGNALSIGEHSEVSASRSFVARSGRVFLLKNASTLNASELLAHSNDVGVRVENESSWYVGSSSLRLDEVHMLNTRLKFDGARSTTTGELIDRLGENDLDGVRRDVLELPNWSSLEAAINQLEQEKVR